ncbi:MAG TPA: 2-amino-4-hydroxy-6-hydroxymethyldihydropteridine diphosphokinase [Steroidobacteraceae bacterium]
MQWIPAYIAIGSNLAQPLEQVRTAFERLARIRDTRLLARSRVYETRPLGPQDQPDFINAVAGLLTRLKAAELLSELKAIERDMGRASPPVRWGPRIIDLDLLLYDAQVIEEPGLIVPHPGIHERNFVLYPLADIAPTLLIPGHGSVGELARRRGADGLRPVA